MSVEGQGQQGDPKIALQGGGGGGSEGGGGAQKVGGAGGFRAGTLSYVVLAALALALSQIPCPEGKVTVQDPQPKAQTPQKWTLLDYFSVPTHRPGWGAAWQAELTGGSSYLFVP